MSVAVGIKVGQTEQPIPFESDWRTMQRLAAGDSSALTEVIEQHGAPLRLLIGRLMAWNDDVDDLLQDVFMDAWNAAARYRGDGPLIQWLRTIAINRCRKHHRARRMLRRAIDQLAHRLGASQTQVAIDREDIDTELRRSQLQWAMGQLKDDDRIAIVLYYLEELASEEVAKALSIRVETLHVRLHRARQRLQQLIQQASVQ